MTIDIETRKRGAAFFLEKPLASRLQFEMEHAGLKNQPVFGSAGKQQNRESSLIFGFETTSDTSYSSNRSNRSSNSCSDNTPFAVKKVANFVFPFPAEKRQRLGMVVDEASGAEKALSRPSGLEMSAIKCDTIINSKIYGNTKLKTPYTINSINTINSNITSSVCRSATWGGGGWLGLGAKGRSDCTQASSVEAESSQKGDFKASSLLTGVSSSGV